MVLHQLSTPVEYISCPREWSFFSGLMTGLRDPDNIGRFLYSSSAGTRRVDMILQWLRMP